MPPIRLKSHPITGGNISFFPNHRMLSSSAHPMSSARGKSQLDVCGEATITVCSCNGCSPTSSNPHRRRIHFASLLFTLLSVIGD